MQRQVSGKKMLDIVSKKDKSLFEKRQSGFFSQKEASCATVFYNKRKKIDIFPARSPKFLMVPNNRHAQLELRIKAESRKEFAGLAASFVNSLGKHFTLARLWNASIAVSIIFGMFSMTFIYKYLGQGALAEEQSKVLGIEQVAVERHPETDEQKLQEEGDLYTRHFIEEAINESGGDLEKEIREMVKGYPIEDMVPYIIEKDKIVAAFLVGIAKKESNWGKRVPVLDGQDCYNLWGYRGIRRLMGTGGHTCFNSRKDAVDTVAKRLEWLIENEELNTPKKMVIWKCGSDCNSTGGWAAANKWIADVNMYFKKLND